MKTWSNGDVSGSQTLTDNDHLYPGHINELRESLNEIEIFNIKDYGAVGDGSNDDTVHIQSAITACETYGGGIVVFPNGTYKITSAIVVNGTYDITLKGWGNSRIRNDNVSGGNSIEIGTSTVRTGRIILDGLLITATFGVNLCGYGILLNHLNRVTLRNVYITDHGKTGIVAKDTYCMVVSRCEIDRCVGSGIHISSAGGNNTTVEFTTVSQCTGSGISVQDSYGFNCVGSNLEWNKYGIYLANNTNVNILNNYFESQTDYSIFIDTGIIGINVLNNCFLTKGIYGISVTNLFFEGNSLTSGGVGFELTGNCPETKFGFNDVSALSPITLGSNNVLENNTINAVADYRSFTKGFLIPRMTTAERDAIASPTEGLLVFNLSTHVLNFYDGSTWQAV